MFFFTNLERHKAKIPTGIKVGFKHFVFGTESFKYKVFRCPPQGTQTSKGFSTKGFRSNDNLADLLSRIRNGYFRSFEDISVIDSKQTRELLDAFIFAGYIHSWKPAPFGVQTKFNTFGIVPNVPFQKSSATANHSTAIMEGNWNATHSGRLVPVPLVSNSYLQVSLKYFKNIPAIRGLQQISRPGRRTYLDVKRILKVSEEQNWGENKTLFLSTSEGILNHREIIHGVGGKKTSECPIRGTKGTVSTAAATEHGVFNKQSLFDCKKSVWQPNFGSKREEFEWNTLWWGSVFSLIGACSVILAQRERYPTH
jgi:ribosomal protein S8